ncbi:unnamed protein product [Rhodiola kirilowii]
MENDLSVTCGEKKERKEKRKLVKGLEKDLGLFSAMRFGINPRTGLAGEVHESMIKEAAEVLLKQLQWLREAEEEARKRRRREKKRKEKAMQLLDEDVGSETHTDSGDGECESSTDFDNSSSKEAEALGESIVAERVVRVMLKGLDRVKKEERCAGTSLEFLNVSSDGSHEVQEVPASTEANVAKAVGQSLIHALACQQESKLQQTDHLGGKKVEICIGGKCRKSGGCQLLEQIHKRAEKEHVEVVGCKCMGKCKNGPNLRLSATNAAPCYLLRSRN